MRTAASIANDVLQSFVYQREDFAALKREFQVLKSDYYEEAIDISLDLKKRREVVDAALMKAVVDNDDPPFFTRDEKRKIFSLENLHCKEIPALIKEFEGFFVSLDKILQMKISDHPEEDLFAEVNKASKNLVAVEAMLYAKPILEFRKFTNLFFDAFKLFTPLEAAMYPNAIDNLIRPRAQLSALANKTFDANRNMQVKGLYHRHSKIIALTLDSYLSNMRISQADLPYSTFSNPEFKDIVRVFESFQKNLYPKLQQTSKSNYNEKLALDIDESQMRTMFNSDSALNQYFHDQISKFTIGDFDHNKNTIKTLLTLDAYKIFNDLHEELGRRPSFEEYALRIDEKSNPIAANIRLGLPGDIKLLQASIGYGSTNNLRKTFNEIAANSRYELGIGFRQDVEAQLESLIRDLPDLGLKPWFQLDSKSPLRVFIADSSRKIFSKINDKFYKQHEKDPVSALRIAIDNFSMKDFKVYLKDIVDLSLKNNVDKKELLRFVYLISRFFNQYLHDHNQDTLMQRLVRRLSGH